MTDPKTLLTAGKTTNKVELTAEAKKRAAETEVATRDGEDVDKIPELIPLQPDQTKEKGTKNEAATMEGEDADEIPELVPVELDKENDEVIPSLVRNFNDISITATGDMTTAKRIVTYCISPKAPCSAHNATDHSILEFLKKKVASMGDTFAKKESEMGHSLGIPRISGSQRKFSKKDFKTYSSNTTKMWMRPWRWAAIFLPMILPMLLMILTMVPKILPKVLMILPLALMILSECMSTFKVLVSSSMGILRNQGGQEKI